jgi:uncharacterized Zn finger protein (UPF0148 family)
MAVLSVPYQFTISLRTMERGYKLEKRTCKWCGKPLNTTDGRVKYHTVNDEGIACKKEAKKEKIRLRQRKYDKNH